MNTTSTRAATFHGLHDHPARPLVLVNVWDAASARLVEDAGATAIATTSAGVAWSLGRPDGNTLTRAEAMDAVARIAASVSVPVTVDVESGYADDADGVARTVDSVLEAGAVGINIEDGRLHPDALADRIGAAGARRNEPGCPCSSTHGPMSTSPVSSIPNDSWPRRSSVLVATAEPARTASSSPESETSRPSVRWWSRSTAR